MKATALKAIIARINGEWDNPNLIAYGPLRTEAEDILYIAKVGGIEMRPIFVFGSNLAGRHGKGAALCAFKEHGAIYGKGTGLQGSSYAIPTKDENLNTLPLVNIQEYVLEFLLFADNHPEFIFKVTRIGCGLAGYKDEDIAPMFKDAPYNCLLPEGW